MLDIKPYIPQYDVPGKIDELQFYSSREAPDGEETAEQATASSSKSINTSITVPNWITNGSTLKVMFNENSDQQVEELAVDKVNVFKQ